MILMSLPDAESMQNNQMVVPSVIIATPPVTLNVWLPIALPADPAVGTAVDATEQSMRLCVQVFVLDAKITWTSESDTRTAFQVLAF